MKTLFLPLDERPCNAQFPQMLANTNHQLTLFMPDEKILAHKRKPADFEGIKEYLLEHGNEVDNVVISLYMLRYGGLIPSRLHHLDVVELENRLDVLAMLKIQNPQLKIYAFQCIMRCPQYNSSEEEPDYYEDYGYALFRKSYLEDKEARNTITKQEQSELHSIHIPQEYEKDYENRRHTNVQMNVKTLELLEKKIIDFLVIPQDDSSPYGYTAMDQKKILSQVKEKKLEYQCMVYPGADEVGMSLLTRAYNDFYNQHISIYPLYASILGPTIIPRYEDRPMYESLKSHIQVTGARMAHSIDDADAILAINCPGKYMQESFDDEKDITYTSYRNLMSFALMIQDFIQKGYKVGLCDSAYSNGGDYDLIAYLDHFDVLDKLYAYAGWNTNCNTLGTVLSQMQLADDIPLKNNIYRYLEDVFYQANVRKYVVENDLKELGLSYYDFKDQQHVVEERISHYLIQHYNKLNLSKKYPIQQLVITMPWKRMFEIGMKVTLR